MSSFESRRVKLDIDYVKKEGGKLPKYMSLKQFFTAKVKVIFPDGEDTYIESEDKLFGLSEKLHLMSSTRGCSDITRADIINLLK